MIYLDNAATTRIDPAVVAAMMPYLTEQYGNPGGLYALSGSARTAINMARSRIADFLGAATHEIYFTGGGSESDNWALIGAAQANAHKGRHIITTKVEHHAVISTCKYLAKNGFEVTTLDVEESGRVDPRAILRAIRPDTILVSVMTANNEIGTIMPIKEIAAITKPRGILLHSDAVAAFGQIPLQVEDLGVDLLSASAHKVHGPKGVGLLYIRSGTKIASYLHGGSQERGLRAGTENVAGIVGFGEAVSILSTLFEETTSYKRDLRDYLIKRLLEQIPYCQINGDSFERTPNNVNVDLGYIEGESALILLDRKGICAASGAACAAGAMDPSHVLLAIGRSVEKAKASLRFTLSKYNTREEIDTVINELSLIVSRLRSMSPAFQAFIS
jgi:cysteine desulfurase